MPAVPKEIFMDGMAALLALIKTGSRLITIIACISAHLCLLRMNAIGVKPSDPVISS